MEIDHCVLGVVPSNSIDPTVTELVVKCQLAAIVILGVFIVAWAIATLIELLKLKTAHNLASIVRAQMDDLRASAVILQGVVEEDFRTNGLARCFMSYHSRLFRISMLVLRMGHYRGICTSIKLSGISVIVGSAYLGFLSVGMMRVLSC
ncbi:hypothetical protein LIER_42263 [Lithospermum erythrorhizon]|uniref:Uncharacterized protein n=1 Tax=Lithospermum erythrorhizon TaxID=34254 RepID=A0AAV3RSJ8_LITER